MEQNEFRPIEPIHSRLKSLYQYARATCPRDRESAHPTAKHGPPYLATSPSRQPTGQGRQQYDSYQASYGEPGSVGDDATPQARGTPPRGGNEPNDASPVDTTGHLGRLPERTNGPDCNPGRLTPHVRFKSHGAHRDKGAVVAHRRPLRWSSPRAGQSHNLALATEGMTPAVAGAEALKPGHNTPRTPERDGRPGRDDPSRVWLKLSEKAAAKVPGQTLQAGNDSRATMPRSNRRTPRLGG